MRYITYPTSEWFVEAFGSAETSDWFTAFEAFDSVHPPSLAVHVPQLDGQAIAPDTWLTALARETELYAGRLARTRGIGEMHWTLGRAPLPPDWLGSLFDVLASGFYLGRRPRLTALVDPFASDEILPCLVAKGFSRIDLGGNAVEAGETREVAADPILAATWQQCVLDQAASIADEPDVSIGIGVLYDVPGQTADQLSHLLDRVLAYRPARVLCQEMPYSIPRLTRQEPVPTEQGPGLPMLQLLTTRLTEAGYNWVAGDTYALRGDLLEIAQRHGHLVMRPYGPSAAAGTTTIALGPAAIGAVGPVYYQNHRIGADYMAAMEQGRLPVMRGVSLAPDDLVRRAVIHSLSCNRFIDIDALNLAYRIDFQQHFSAEMPILKRLEQAELISRTTSTIEIVGEGSLLVDSICSVFDAHLRRYRSSKPYTRLL